MYDYFVSYKFQDGESGRSIFDYDMETAKTVAETFERMGMLDVKVEKH